MKKKIGVSYTRTYFQNYWNWFTPQDLADDFELVELSFEKNNTEEIYTCDGFVLTGGVDVDPSFYDGESDYKNKPGLFQPERDRFEATIYQHSQLHKLPVLGICRGMQLINVLEGGKLIQDLNNGNERHKKEESDKEHTIVAENNTLLYNIAGTGSGYVNSAHHQAIDPGAIGDNLKVNAFDDDDERIIEGLEFNDKTDKGFMICVQWHPERMKEGEQNPFSDNLKKQFLSAMKETSLKKLAIINPATEEVIAEVAEDTQTSIKEKFNLLRTGQKLWASTDLARRLECIERFYDLLDTEKDELAKTLTSEMGKPLQQSHNELNGARNRIKFFIENSAKWLADEWINTEGATKEKISYEPLGIIANISAWNYPYLVGVNVFIPALIGGNAVFYKPSEYATLTGLAIQKLLYQSGIPENAFQIATGKGDVGEMLLQLPLDGYFFTGSYRTGKYIAEKVASKLIPCQLELGGKDPLYVMDDIADIDKVAAAALEGVVYNNGQSCCAVERIYVHEKIYDTFVKSYSEQAKKLQIGDPMDASTEIGPLSRKEQKDFLLAQINDAKKKGAVIVSGGNAVAGKGYFIEPTVMVNVNHDMRIMKEESFGPVIGIQKVKDDHEALQLMQDTEYGLTSAIYSQNFERAEAMMRQINTGTVYWNCCDRVSASLPWSGRKHSGLGSTLSYQGIRAFVQPKAYHIRDIN
jgi:acyl-CoA reductase-like NAD-dependent aldehyde dehydrogenase/GMP synthase-like glutamine amidotransferase